MPVLSAQDRRVVWSSYMQEPAPVREEFSVNKRQLRQAVNAIDQWLEDNQASLNSAIPPAVRTALSTRQKLRMLVYVLNQRARR